MIVGTEEVVKKMIEDNKTSGKVIIIDFYADWCGPCRTLGPVLNTIATENENIEVIKVNVDENTVLSSEFGIRSIPAVFIYKDGEKVNQFAGMKSKEDILKLV
jgi:thioredoxin 1